MRWGIVGMADHSCEADLGETPTIAHLVRGIVQGLPPSEHVCEIEPLARSLSTRRGIPAVSSASQFGGPSLSPLACVLQSLPTALKRRQPGVGTLLPHCLPSSKCCFP